MRRIGPTKAVSIEPMQGMKKMREIAISGNTVPDLRPLLNMPNLSKLELGHCVLQDVSPLAEIKSLRKFFLAGSEISDEAALLALMPQLTEVDFQLSQP